MKVLFVIQNFQVGGIQKSLINICKALLEYYPDIAIEIYSFGDGILSSMLPKKINIIYGGRLLRNLLTPVKEIIGRKNYVDIIIRCAMIGFAKIFGTEKLYRFLFSYEQIEKHYDVAISFFNDVEAGVSNKGTNWYAADFVDADHKIAWIHTDPVGAKFDIKRCNSDYLKFNNIACVSSAVKNKFDKIFPELRRKTSVVYNYAPVEEIIEKSKCQIESFDNNIFNIVTVARIDNSTKRIDRIIEICSLLKREYFPFKWRIVGSGLDLEKNINLAREKDVLDVLEFVGMKENPYPYISQSDLFVLTSDYEGYGLVLLEAIILQVPVVTTNFDSAKEILTNEIEGYITSMDVNDIKGKIVYILENQQVYKKFVNNIQMYSKVNCHWKKQMDAILKK